MTVEEREACVWLCIQWSGYESQSGFPRPPPRLNYPSSTTINASRCEFAVERSINIGDSTDVSKPENDWKIRVTPRIAKKLLKYLRKRSGVKKILMHRLIYPISP
jgi:hypothetical protein